MNSPNEKGPEKQKGQEISALARSIDSALVRGTNGVHDEIKSVTETDPETTKLAKALKEDKEGTNTKVEMIAIAPGDEAGFHEWMEKYTTIFTDPGDMEDEETIRAHWEQGLAILYMVEGAAESTTQKIGIRLAAVNSKVPHATYVPYGGMDEKFRGSLGYTRAMQHNEKDLAARGVDVVLNDCEDETRLAAFRESYKDDDGSQKSDAEIAKICQNRLHFFMKNGYVFVDDADVKYQRPGSDDPLETQAYDRLGFKIIGNDAKYAQYFELDADGNKAFISKEGYKAMYLALHTLDQYSDLDEAGLRAAFPAIDGFLTKLEESPKEKFPIYKDVVVDKK